MPLGVAFTAAFLLLARPSSPSLALSLPLVAAGLGLRACAAGTLRKKAVLATTGPYAHTRNPLYLGSLLVGLGFALASARWPIGLALVATFAAIYAPTIAGEERLLRERFPEFEDYVRAVPRLWPRLTPAPSRGERGSFSLAQYARNREYEALIGALAVYGVLVARAALA